MYKYQNNEFESIKDLVEFYTSIFKYENLRKGFDNGEIAKMISNHGTDLEKFLYKKIGLKYDHFLTVFSDKKIFLEMDDKIYNYNHYKDLINELGLQIFSLRLILIKDDEQLLRLNKIPLPAGKNCDELAKELMKILPEFGPIVYCENENYYEFPMLLDKNDFDVDIENALKQYGQINDKNYGFFRAAYIASQDYTYEVITEEIFPIIYLKSYKNRLIPENYFSGDLPDEILKDRFKIYFEIHNNDKLLPAFVKSYIDKNQKDYYTMFDSKYKFIDVEITTDMIAEAFYDNLNMLENNFNIQEIIDSLNFSLIENIGYASYYEKIDKINRARFFRKLSKAGLYIEKHISSLVNALSLLEINENEFGSIILLNLDNDISNEIFNELILKNDDAFIALHEMVGDNINRKINIIEILLVKILENYTEIKIENGEKNSDIYLKVKKIIGNRGYLQNKLTKVDNMKIDNSYFKEIDYEASDLMNYSVKQLKEEYGEESFNDYVNGHENSSTGVGNFFWIALILMIKFMVFAMNN